MHKRIIGIFLAVFLLPFSTVYADEIISYGIPITSGNLGTVTIMHNGKSLDFQTGKAYFFMGDDKNSLMLNKDYLNTFAERFGTYFEEDINTDKFFPVKKSAGRYELSKKTKVPVKVDAEKLEAELTHRIVNNNYTPLELPVYAKDNETEDDNKDYVVLLSSYKTLYPPGDVNRVYNIITAANHMSGIKIAPGETFSFNRIANQIDSKYRDANIILGGRFVPGHAGGLCQLSTTTFNAAVLSGLCITERNNHTLAINYVPLGMDAMVSKSSDLKFKNNLQNPIYLFSYAPEKNSILVEIYGSPEDRHEMKLDVQRTGRGYTLKTYRDNNFYQKFYSSYGG